MKPFRVKVVFTNERYEVYRFEDREEAFAFAQSLFGDDAALGVKYTVIAPE